MQKMVVNKHVIYGLVFPLHVFFSQFSKCEMAKAESSQAHHFNRTWYILFQVLSALTARSLTFVFSFSKLQRAADNRRVCDDDTLLFQFTSLYLVRLISIASFWSTIINIGDLKET